MISQSEANRLLDILKSIIESGEYKFPDLGEENKLNLISNDEKYHFVIDINRKSKIKTNKYTYQKKHL